GALGVGGPAEALGGAEHAHLAGIGVGGVDAREHLEERRLAGAVLAAQAEDLARRGREIGARERAHAAEALLDADQLGGGGAGLGLGSGGGAPLVGGHRLRYLRRRLITRRSKRSEGVIARRSSDELPPPTPAARQRQAPRP